VILDVKKGDKGKLKRKDKRKDIIMEGQELTAE
jgi:hypothetical protein